MGEMWSMFVHGVWVNVRGGYAILRGLFLRTTPTPIAPVRTPTSLAIWDMSPSVCPSS